MSPVTGKSIEVDGEVVAERRDELRKKTLKGAAISFNSGYSTFECIVRNQSDRGARLAFAETFALPSSFWLMISGERARKAEVKWRSLTAVGVTLA